MKDSAEMIRELKDYLDKKQKKYYEDSFDFKGLRENVPQPDGSEKDLFVISYLVSVSNQKYDSDKFHFAYFDKGSMRLSYIIGPQFFEIIKE